MRHTNWHYRLTLGARLLAAAGLLTPLAAAAGAVPLADAPASAARQPAEAASWRFHADHVLGTSMDLVAVSHDEATAQEALAVVRAEIARLDQVLSSYRPDSELAALNRCSEMQVSADLFNVVAACEAWREATAGAFSGRLGRALASWQRAAATGQLDLATLQREAAEAAAATVVLDPATRTVRRPEAVEFAMDALAKGYIIDQAMQAARRQVAGLDGLLLDIGGDMRSWGR
ncbi:FAD:protein FMN transferase, partial [Chitinimonas sp.]|uniref:FAD:protein FMN transferase n=1 Tax=Chitinimonas sp. TaxID=1934313 RepID=UPI002F94D91E